ncbi:hypothetical protein [Rhodoferax sp. GW822-FHT02A01]|uniref:hypothetical protein n=1 Tax=Rhodoferax sp. GW822-FHT02A01 TaxID=3141537 RepID=UPI00315D8196
MPTALYIELPDALPARPDCPVRHAQAQRWLADLPPDLLDLVVAPVSIDVFHEYEMQAERTQGRDAANAPCFCEYRFVLTQLRSDDNEVFYETPVYAETLTSWRLLDERWLVCRTTLDRLGQHGSQTILSLSDHMPR